MKTPQPILYIIIGSLSLSLLGIIGCFIMLCFTELPPPTEVFGALKDICLINLGALTGLLVNTRSAEVKPPDNTVIQSTESNASTTTPKDP